MGQVVEPTHHRRQVDDRLDRGRGQAGLESELVPRHHAEPDVLEQVAVVHVLGGALGLVVDDRPAGKVVVVAELLAVAVVLVHVVGDVDEVEAVGAGDGQTLLVDVLGHPRDGGGHALGVEEEVALGGFDPAGVHEGGGGVHDGVDVVQPDLQQALAPVQFLGEDGVDLALEDLLGLLVVLAVEFGGGWGGPDGQTLLDALDQDDAVLDADGVGGDVGFHDGLGIGGLAGREEEEVAHIDDEDVVAEVEGAQGLQDGVLAVRGHSDHDEGGELQRNLDVTGGLDTVGSADLAFCLDPAVVFFNHGD